MTRGLEIRPFDTLEEYRECVTLQEEVWGEGFSERVSVAILKVSQRLGGVSAGAYGPDGRLMGFVFGMTGIEDGRPVHWSDMLAVRPEVQDSGLGARLKRYQRARVMERGVEKMYWTFDPLESKNAYLNFAKLGIVAREYVPDMYGETDSPLHKGIGTDRLVALWLLDSDRVRGRMEGGDEPPGSSRLEGVPKALDLVREDGDLVPLEGEPPDGTEVTVAIPREIQRLKERSPEKAAAWRRSTRRAFTHFLARGFEVRELVPGEELSHYLLARLDER